VMRKFRRFKAHRGRASRFLQKLVSVSTLFDGASHSLFDVLFGAGADRFPDATERAAVLTAVKDAARRWRGGPKAGHP